MKHLKLLYKLCTCLLLPLALAGCSGDGRHTDNGAQADEQPQEEVRQEDLQEEQPGHSGEPSKEESPQTAQPKPPKQTDPVIEEADWSAYFEEASGAAVVYDPSENCFQIYGKELALTRRSPCSTFKIISSLIALENGIIEPDDSTRAWSGETFWNADWNRDIDFADAFHASCVWYFREVIDEIGAELMQEQLDRLGYGNRDISDWEGRLNTNNHNRSLTGFWIESSLLISPKEQVEVLERIFGDDSDYSENTKRELMQVMLIPEQSDGNVSIYGKTGMGKAHGRLADAWFTGFADFSGRRIYFCVYLGETDDENVSSATAREIAIRLVSDFVNHHSSS